MATHPEDHNPPHHGDEHQPRQDPAKKPEGEPIPEAEAHPESPPAPHVPNMSLDEPEEVIPVLEAADTPGPAASDVVTLEPVEDIPVLEAAPESGIVDVLPVEDEPPPAPHAPSEQAAPPSDVVPLDVLPEGTAGPPTNVEATQISSGSGSHAGAAPGDITEQVPVDVTQQVPVVYPPPGEPEAPPASDVAEAMPASDVAEASPISDEAAAQPASDIAAAEPVFEDVFAEPVSGGKVPDVTGAELPRADLTGAEHVLGEDLARAEPASGPHGGAVPSDVFETAEPVSAIEGADAVLGDEPLDLGSRPSARAESPIRTEPDDEEVDLGALSPGEAPAAAVHRKGGHDIDMTEEVLTGEPAGVGSSAINWDDVDEAAPASGKAAQDVEETAAFVPEAGEADEASAVDLGAAPGKSKSPSGIDPVAEALESGVNLDEDLPLTPVKHEASVEFDDILTDEVEPPPAKRPGARKAEPEAEAAAEEEPARPSKKKKKKTTADIEEEAAAALFADEAEAVAVPADETEAVAVPADEAEAVAVPADEDEAVAAPVADDEDRPRRKKRRTRAAEEEIAASKPAPAPAPAGPGCLGRLVGATFFLLLGVLVAAGGLAAAVYFAPNEFDDLYRQLPNAKQPAPPAPKAPPLTPAQQAFAALAAGSYDQALTDLKDEADPQAVAVRGEARWLKYVKAQTEAKKPLSEKDADVQEAVKDLRTAKNDVLAEQILRAVREPAVAAQLAKANASADALKKDLARTEADRKAAEATLTEIGTALAGAKVIDKADDLKPEAVQKVLKELGDVKTTVAGVDKVLEQANIKDAGPKGVKQLLDAKEDNEKKLDAVNKALGDAKVKDPGAKGVQELLAARDKLQKDRDDLDAATRAAFAELVKAKVVPADADPRKALADAARRVREKSESPLALPLTEIGSTLGGLGFGLGRLVEKGVDAALANTELGFFRAREQFIQTPAQKMDMYMTVFQDRNRKDPKELDAVRREAAWVLNKDANAPPVVRGKAHYVTAMTLRNEQKFEEARKEFAAAVADAEKSQAKGSWAKEAKEGLAELTDPRAYFLPQIEKLQNAGDLKKAVAETDLALKAIAGNGALLAQRGLLRLEQARQGKAKLTAEVQQQVRADAEAAVKTKEGAAAGAYALGLLEEELGQYGKAEEHYRKALTESRGDEEAAARYRIALARVLLRELPAAAPAPAAPAKEGADRRPVPGPAVVHPVTALLLSVTFGTQGVQPGRPQPEAPPGALRPVEEPEAEVENPDVAKRVRESIELAKSLTTSKDPRVREQGYALLAQAAGRAGAKLTSATCLDLAKDLLNRDDPKVKGTGYLLRGEALVKQGRRTEGLKEYSRGMALLYPGMESKEIGKMVEEHPAFQHPDASNRPNPVLAEKHFGEGLHLYWSGRYPEAEVQFKQAIDYFSQDARYYYYLGLAQLAQRTTLKRDQAYYSFEKGAQLEAMGRPGIAEINFSLERVQGNLRQLLNSFRNKATALTATP